MIRNINSVNIQAVSVQATENAEAQTPVSSQPQPVEEKNAPATTANSANTWQRASLVQDGVAQQTKLAQSYERSKAEVEQAKEAKEENQSATFWGTIFGGPIIGSIIGNAIETNASGTEAKKSPLRDMLQKTEEEMKRLQEQLKEVQDNSFVETVGDWFVGNDAGQSEMAEATNQNPNKNVPIEAYTKVQYDPDDD